MIGRRRGTTLQAELARRLWLARLAIFWERLWPALWPATAVVGIFLDLDNLNPGRASPERAAVMAHRLREAARQLGGGALGGVAPDDDARAPALVVAFRAFGNAETVSPAIAEALEAAGAEVCRVEGAEPDAADLALGANLDAFANAWAADASAPPPPGFLTERVVDALRREAAASSSSLSLIHI